MRQKLHYDWHWFWETGTGEVGNLGAHNIDESRWVIGQRDVAPRAVTIGGRIGMDDDGQTANTQVTSRKNALSVSSVIGLTCFCGETTANPLWFRNAFDGGAHKGHS